MEQGSSDPGRDSDQFPLTGEDFYLAGARKFWQVHGTPAADSSGHLFGGHHARKLRQQLARVNEHFVGFARLRGRFELLKRVRLSQVEFAEGRPAQGF